MSRPIEVQRWRRTPTDEQWRWTTPNDEHGQRRTPTKKQRSWTECRKWEDIDKAR
ncbi:hypothetical protein PanWU01x14_019590, partial [Parasponia andersonii]